MEKRASGIKKNYMAAALAVSLLAMAIIFIRIVTEDKVVTEYSSDYVAMAELPSQLSFTYYGEEEWKDKLR